MTQYAIANHSSHPKATTWAAFAGDKATKRANAEWQRYLADMIDLGADDYDVGGIDDRAHITRSDFWAPGIDDDTMWLRTTDGNGRYHRFMILARDGWADGNRCIITLYTDGGVYLSPQMDVAHAIAWCEGMAGKPVEVRDLVAAQRIGGAS